MADGGASHGTLYAEEYGFDSRVEALVASVAGAFLAQQDPARDLYHVAGFRPVASEPHSMFGPAMVGEDWELTL